MLASHFSVNCMAPGIGDRFVATGRVVKPGRRQVFAAGELFALQAQGEAQMQERKLIATGHAILVPVEAGN